MAVHAAAEGFDTSAGEYARARPEYPRPAIRQLLSVLGARPGQTIVDLAAGTGKLTRQLRREGVTVVAVEPVRGMRGQLAASLPDVPMMAGVAESLAVRDGAVRGVAVAQAFHWFDGERALAEVHRVLEPGGVLAMIWNVRDRDHEWVGRLAEITEAYAPEVPRYRSGEWRSAFESTDLFEPLTTASYPYPHEVDAQTMVDRIASISWISVLPQAERGRVLDRVRAVFDGMPERFVVPYHTELHWCRARAR